MKSSKTCLISRDAPILCNIGISKNILYIGNHSKKKSYVNSLLWHSSRENIRRLCHYYSISALRNYTLESSHAKLALFYLLAKTTLVKYHAGKLCDTEPHCIYVEKIAIN